MKYPILALAISLTLPANSAGAKDLFVAPNGADTNAGTLARPFKTIRQAAQVAQAGDVVQVRAGTYRETVVPKNDGVAGRPIVFQPYQNEKVTISGTAVLQGWKAGPNGVWQAPMTTDYFRSSINQSNQIFVNGQMMNLARWPNTGLDVSRPAKAQLTKFISKTQDKETRWWTAVFEDDNLEPKADGFYNGAEIYVQPNYGAWSWTLSGRVVEHKGKQLTLQSRSGTGQDGKQDVYAVNSRYYLFNKRELLDAPGEWFHDKAQSTLFLQPPAGVNLANAIVEAKKRDFGIDLTGRSYITVKGINLFGCTLTTDNAAGGDAVGYNEDGTERYPWRNGEWIAPAHHIVVDGISAKYLNHFTDVSGHFFLQWGPTTGIVIAGQDNLIQNCRVQYSAGNGISLQGLRHKCLNNVVLDTAYMATDTAGISTGTSAQTKDLEIAYNTVYRTGRSGITLRQLQNSDPTRLVTRVHHNDIANYAIQDWDAGAFYMFGQDGKWTRIDHNWFHCDEPRTDIVFGAYWDFSKNYILDHNVIWGVPTPIQVTHAFDNDNTKINNFLIYNNTGTTNHAMWSHAFGSVENNGSVVQNNILKAASFKDPKGTLILRWPGYGSGKVTSQKNLVWGAVTNAGWTEGKPRETDLKADEAGFANSQTGNFQLQAGSPAIDAGVPMQPVEREGITVPAFNDKIVGAAPDLGAYEFGGEMWKAGSTLATAADKQ
jgi:hypothetical protein